MAFDNFSRGDLIYKGSVLAEVTNGRAHLTNGSAIVKTLRRGVAGSHKGTLEATISFSIAVIKAGMREDFVKVINKQQIVKIVAILADDLSIEVEGIMQSADFSFSETGMVTGDFSITGKPNIV